MAWKIIFEDKLSSLKRISLKKKFRILWPIQKKDKKCFGPNFWISPQSNWRMLYQILLTNTMIYWCCRRFKYSYLEYALVFVDDAIVGSVGRPHRITIKQHWEYDHASWGFHSKGIIKTSSSKVKSQIGEKGKFKYNIENVLYHNAFAGCNRGSTHPHSNNQIMKEHTQNKHIKPM